ncbi:MAG: hypothetical protein ACREEE_16695 [Dongiaceae bacterium]
MLLQRDLLVVALTLGLAAAIYAFSFRDLAIADPVLSGTEIAAASQQLVRVSTSVPAFAG